MRARFQFAVAIIAVMLIARVSAAQLHAFTEHGFAVVLPRGWDRTEALSGNTVLKLTRTNTPLEEARIVVAAFLPERRVDITGVSRDEQIRALEGGSVLGEKVTVLDIGHTQVARNDAIWGKTHRELPSRGSTYEYTYEFSRDYKGIPKVFTIRLTCYGNEEWFRSNAPAFDAFIQSIRFEEQTPLQTGVETRRLSSDQSAASSSRSTATLVEPPRLQITDGDPLWLALIKGFGETFLLILLATIGLGIAKWAYSKYGASRPRG